MPEIIPIGADGYYHPKSEAEIIAIIQAAAASNPPRKVRVRGASHSVTASIYTTGYDGIGTPPDGAFDLMLDRYRAIGTITPVPGDPAHATVEVEAGCNLGRNPYDPTGTSTWENSLDLTLQKAGWAFDDLGGISHQTVSGFISTGSSGGSLTHAIDEDIVGIRILDGNGTPWDLRRDDTDPVKRDMFFAAGVSMGLLGIISRVTFRVRRSFNIYGTQVTASTSDIYIDLFGDGGAGKPSLLQFLRQTPYTRLMWWPQHGFSRVQVWQAARMEPVEGFVPQPYEELTQDPRYADLASLAGSLIYTIIGNLEDVAAIPAKLGPWYQHFEDLLAGQPVDNGCRGAAPGARIAIQKSDILRFVRDGIQKALEDAPALNEGNLATLGDMLGKLGVDRAALPGWLADLVTKLVEMVLDGIFDSRIAQGLADLLAPLMPYVIGPILGVFVSDGAQTFWDTWMCGLPMDNQMDDQLWPTEFTELWIPVEKTAEVMRALKAFYDGGGDAKVAYEHTGSFSCELYAAKKSEFWLSPAYQTDVFRVDVFWFAYNAGEAQRYYAHFYELLRPFAFRPHWGKFVPPASPEWVAYYRERFPRFDDFLALREKLDPRQIFLNEYWRENFGIPRT